MSFPASVLNVVDIRRDNTQEQQDRAIYRVERLRDIRRQMDQAHRDESLLQQALVAAIGERVRLQNEFNQVAGGL